MPKYTPTTEDKLYLLHARSYEQFAHMRQLLEDGLCSFCLRDSSDPPVIETEFWLVKPNLYPYSHLRDCLVFYPKAHIERIRDLRIEQWTDYGVMINQAIGQFDIPGGAIVTRFDDVRYNVGTVRHFHGHILVPDLTGPVKATFAKTPERLRELEAQLDEYERRWQEALQEKPARYAMT